MSEAPGAPGGRWGGPPRAPGRQQLRLAARNLVGTRTLESRDHEEPQVPTVEAGRARPHVTLIAHRGGQHGEQLPRRGLRGLSLLRPSPQIRASRRGPASPSHFGLLRSTLFPPLFSRGDPLSVFPWCHPARRLSHRARRARYRGQVAPVFHPVLPVRTPDRQAPRLSAVPESGETLCVFRRGCHRASLGSQPGWASIRISKADKAPLVSDPGDGEVAKVIVLFGRVNPTCGAVGCGTWVPS